MPGGGMMFNRIVVQDEGKKILDEFEVQTTEYQKGYHIADSLETVSTICSQAMKAGAKIFNLIGVEDVLIREDDRIAGLVLNWSATSLAKLHVDPLSIRSKIVIDATGHESDICRIVERKIGAVLRTKTGGVMGEKSMWAEVGEKMLLAWRLTPFSALPGWEPYSAECSSRGRKQRILLRKSCQRLQHRRVIDEGRNSLHRHRAPPGRDYRH
jgi:thiazole biosynthesis enzyme